MPKETRHAARTNDGDFLCGAGDGRTTKPKESVNCPMCRVILNNVRERYPAHAEYDDWRLTRTSSDRRHATWLRTCTVAPMTDEVRSEEHVSWLRQLWCRLRYGHQLPEHLVAASRSYCIIAVCQRCRKCVQL